MFCDFPKYKHLKQTIFRGPGGTGSATSDSDTTEFQEFLVQSQAARDAALAAQAAAELAETNAETAETNAETAETNAETAATNAASSASAASSSASAASSSASAASTSASSASTSASSASTSASSASTSASAASTSATAAAASATNAAASATAAASSATSASSSASTATTQASNAASSASAASTSATSASTSASSASTSATNAASSATSAASSATAAASSATDAAASAASINDANLVHKTGNETIAGTKTFNTNQVIAVTDNTNAALRVTQLGTGNSLLIEDSTNPDSTPFVVNADGRVISGFATSRTTAVGEAQVQINGGTAPLSLIRQADSSTAINLEFAKARSIGAILNSGDTIGRLYFSGSDGTAQIPAAYIDAAVDGTPGTNDMPGRLVFSTTADGSSSPTERMRIDSSGNVGIGTSSPNYKLTANGGAGPTVIQLCNTASGTTANDGFLLYQDGVDCRVQNTEAGNMLFYTGNTERARIDSSGNLLVGTTSAAGKLTVANSGGSAFKFDGSTTAGAFTGDDVNHYMTTYNSKAGGAVTHYQIGFYNSSGTNVGAITHNFSNTTYSTSSDYRLKENIEPMTGALSVVEQLKPCTYTWKATGEDGQGFIAHELQAVVPDAVVGEKDAVNEDGSIKPQGIDTSFLVATLTAAIQEQQQLITALTARVAALETAAI